MPKPTWDHHLREGKPLLLGARSHYSMQLSRTILFAAYFKSPLMERAASWRHLFQKEKHIPIVYLQASHSYQGLHLSPLLPLCLQSGLKCSVDRRELRAISGCSHSQTSAHPNSIPDVQYTSQLHSNTQGKNRETISQAFTFGSNSQGVFWMHGWHPHFCPGNKRHFGLHADIFWEKNTAGKMRFSSSLGLC